MSRDEELAYAGYVEEIRRNLSEISRLAWAVGDQLAGLRRVVSRRKFSSICRRFFPAFPLSDLNAYVRTSEAFVDSDRLGDIPWHLHRRAVQKKLSVECLRKALEGGLDLRLLGTARRNNARKDLLDERRVVSDATGRSLGRLAVYVDVRSPEQEPVVEVRLCRFMTCEEAEEVERALHSIIEVAEHYLHLLSSLHV